jgi:hypothetical protein
LGHLVPSFGLRDGTATCELRERRGGIVPQKEPYFPPSEWRVRHQKAEVRINSRDGSDEDVHTTQHRHLQVQALL